MQNVIIKGRGHRCVTVQHRKYEGRIVDKLNDYKSLKIAQLKATIVEPLLYVLVFNLVQLRYTSSRGGHQQQP